MTSIPTFFQGSSISLKNEGWTAGAGIRGWEAGIEGAGNGGTGAGLGYGVGSLERLGREIVFFL